MGLVALIAVLNHGSMSLHLLFTTVRVAESIAILAFTATGVVIGLLLK